MKTVIRKRYRDGFRLTEQDVRRIVQVLVEAEAKATGQPLRLRLFLRLANGTILEIKDVEELLAQENSGQREIAYLYIAIESFGKLAKGEESHEEEDETWYASVRFERQNNDSLSRWPISIDVHGESRDWVVLTASNLGERVSAVKRHAVTRWIQSPSAPAVLLVFLIAALGFFVATILNRPPAYLTVERAYAAGTLVNPIEALILLEKTRRGGLSSQGVLLGTIVFVFFSFALAFALPWVARTIATPYVFCWGDYVSVYGRRRTIVFTIWTAVVLASVVGVFSTYLSKLLGI